MAEHDLQSVAFPRLDDAQMAKLASCAATAQKTFRDGEFLFRVGQQDMKFFVVKSGTVEIIDTSGSEPRVVTVHHPGHFTGDVSHLTGARAIVSAVARGDCEVFEVSNLTLRHILDDCPDLSDIILRAFIARRFHHSVSKYTTATPR